MDDTASNTSQVRSQNLGGQGTDADVGQQEWATDGLAISTNGDASFAAIVSGAGVDRSIRIHKLLATASVHTQDYWGNTGLSNLPNVTVGAMKKVGADDYYYFGTFRTSGITTVQLDLFAYNAATKAFIGQVARVTVASDLLALISSSTGDIAFDAQGRLMILWGSPTQLAASRLMRLDTVPSTAWDNTTVLASTELSAGARRRPSLGGHGLRQHGQPVAREEDDAGDRHDVCQGQPHDGRADRDRVEERLHRQ